MKCITCNVELSLKTQCKSFFERGFKSCRVCAGNYKKKRYAKLRIELLEKRVDKIENVNGVRVDNTPPPTNSPVRRGR